MNSKHYLVMSGIVGGVVGSLLTALLVPPVTAQRDKFGEIECTKLTVVNKDSIPVVHLASIENSGIVRVYDDSGTSRVNLAMNKHGGFVVVSGKDGLPVAALDVDERGGSVKIYGHDHNIAQVQLYTGEHGGNIAVCNNNGYSRVKLDVTDDNGGIVVLGNDRENREKGVALGLNEHGGLISVAGKSNGKAIMSINRDGEGIVSTWDKGMLRTINGNRLKY